jgi:DNA-binding GntR family transcriptional regulator
VGVTGNIVNNIRQKIISGEFKPGQKLNEILISNTINVSSPPLREAFRILEHEQLVFSIPRKGTYVAKISKEDLENVYRAREMVECFTIELLKLKDKTDLPGIETALCNAAKADPEKKMDYLMAFIEFHLALVRSAGNSFLDHFYQAICSNLARYQYMYAWLPGLTRDSQGEHQKIYNHIKEGDFDSAKDCLRTHIRKFVDLLKETIDEKELSSLRSHP